jgi:hypothetical protein
VETIIDREGISVLDTYIEVPLGVAGNAGLSVDGRGDTAEEDIGVDSGI